MIYVATTVKVLFCHMLLLSAEVGKAKQMELCGSIVCKGFRTHNCICSDHLQLVCEQGLWSVDGLRRS